MSSDNTHFPQDSEIVSLIPSPSIESFEVGERVFAWHHKRLYEAKVLEVRTPKGKSSPMYLIHYTGWKERWDEQVPPERLLKYIPSNKALESRVAQISTQHRAGKRKPPAGLGTLPGQSGSSGGFGKDDNPGKRQRRASRAIPGGSQRVSPSSSREDSMEALHDSLRWQWSVEMMPTRLKRVLVDDYKYINDQQHLLAQPASHSVLSICTHFLQQLPAQAPRREEYVKVMDALVVYFEKSLGCLLLYRFEKLQYAELLESSAGQQPQLSLIYGAETFLRLFVKLTSILSFPNIDDSCLRIFYSVVDEFLEWLNFNSARYFDRKHYEPAPPHYLRFISRS